MGIFSKTCEYALRAVFYIAHQTENDRRVGLKQIASAIESPEKFLAKILQDLSRKGIIKSAKGPHGGFFMDQEGLHSHLSDVVEAIDGNNIFVGCALGMSYCSEKNPCPLHHDFVVVRNKITHMLKNTTIGDFNEDLNLGLTSLKK
jgi:Rrf2 family protein